MSIKDIKQQETNFIVEKKDNYSKIEVEIGDIKQVDFFPQAKLKYWDNECNFSIRYNKDPDGTYELIDNKVKWSSKDGKKKVHMYELEGYEDGGFEIEVELLEKPSSNIIEYSLQTKELDFRFQSEDIIKSITKTFQEVPENVIGSYAVYHKTKRNNYNDKNGNPVGNQYRTGKAFHIYRPEAIDNEGNKIWCDLNIDDGNNLLTIIVPQKYLDNAIYPVIVDPTFGYTSQGSVKIDGYTNEVYGQIGTSGGTAGEADSVHYYGSTSFTPIKGFISLTSTGDILTNGIAGISEEYGSDWYSLSFSTKPTITASTGYTTCFVSSGDSADFYADGGGSSGWRIDDSNSYSSPQSIGSSPTNGGADMSIYTTYTETVSGWTHTINGVTAANMSYVNGVAKADIDEIDGV